MASSARRVAETLQVGERPRPGVEPDRRPRCPRPHQVAAGRSPGPGVAPVAAEDGEGQHPVTALPRSAGRLVGTTGPAPATTPADVPSSAPNSRPPTDRNQSTSPDEKNRATPGPPVPAAELPGRRGWPARRTPSRRPTTRAPRRAPPRRRWSGPGTDSGCSRAAGCRSRRRAPGPAAARPGPPPDRSGCRPVPRTRRIPGRRRR